MEKWGPVGIYGHEFKAVYNHPPLIGYLLYTYNWLVAHGVADLSTLVKLPSIFADLVSSLVVFDLVRRARSLREGTAAGLAVALSPALFVISGFHGNNDPLFVMFALVAAWLLMTRRSASLAGVAIALAVSVKLIPVILVPVLALAAWRWGFKRLVAFLVGSGLTMGVIWAPAVLLKWTDLKAQVLGYAGIGVREWGPVQFAKWLHAPDGLVDLMIGPGRWVSLLLGALLPVALVWRRPEKLHVAIGLGFAVFLLLSPAFGMQYLTWPLAAAYLVNFWVATGYHVAASTLIWVVYERWNEYRWPWDWWQGRAVAMNTTAFTLAVVSWVALLAVVVAGLVVVLRAWRSPAEPDRDPDQHDSDTSDLPAGESRDEPSDGYRQSADVVGAK
ncbi:hypothetical protein Asi02nite_44320 [Asanoa siamensis]|uniref:DUF2029 domain-containing protein n=1 Tax=Asanoa siamensis TaxID=926357 RepID=A0ABQ4CUG6_9ACTN|nr:hypothetical protein Asi02nite_44320 [Asanoa siamensis]